MNRNQLILGVVAVVSMFAGIMLFQVYQPTPQSQTVHSEQQLALAAIPLESLNHESSIINDWKSQVLVVNFWAPWCAPCREEIPTLRKISSEYPQDKVVILGIALDGEEAVRQFAAEYEINYPLFLAGNRIPMYNAAFGNPSGSLPFTAIINQDQQIIYKHNGIVTKADLDDQLKNLL
ncbi:MAG: TlpA disulfide reductase family protein [Pseudomonadota bacterium]